MVDNPDKSPKCWISTPREFSRDHAGGTVDYGHGGNPAGKRAALGNGILTSGFDPYVS